ncbi:MAG: hypothetical protein AB1630_11115 [bacterium]
MKFTVDEEKLYEVVEKAVNKAMEENLKRLKLELIPYVDDDEMEKIREIFKEPKKYKYQEFVQLDL